MPAPRHRAAEIIILFASAQLLDLPIGAVAVAQLVAVLLLFLLISDCDHVP